MTEFNLSEHIKKYGGNPSYLRASKVKEFIRLVKEIGLLPMQIEKINQLAGEKFI